MITLKTPDQIRGIKNSCQLAKQTLDYTAGFIKPGVSTETLNRLAHQFIIDHQAIPAPLNYNGFPKSICTSVNNIVCHGIPSSKKILKSGDIINIDITTILNSFYGDTSATYFVDQVPAATVNFVNRVKESLFLSIHSLAPGKSLNQCVGKVIEPYLTKFGYSVVRDLGGHGVGLEFHEEPFVYHFDTKKGDIVLKPGMIFTIEPMVNMSPDWHVTLDKHDGWTVYTRDGSLSAQFEHTVLITDSSYEILTL